jgi:hypothetical protein
MKPNEWFRSRDFSFLIELPILFLGLASAFFGFMTWLATQMTCPRLGVLEEHVLSQNPEMRLVGS